MNKHVAKKYIYIYIYIYIFQTESAEALMAELRLRPPRCPAQDTAEMRTPLVRIQEPQSKLAYNKQQRYNY